MQGGKGRERALQVLQCCLHQEAGQPLLPLAPRSRASPALPSPPAAVYGVPVAPGRCRAIVRQVGTSWQPTGRLEGLQLTPCTCGCGGRAGALFPCHTPAACPRCLPTFSPPQPFRFKNKLIPKLFGLSPRFMGHLGNNSVLDEDVIFLHMQVGCRAQ